jgi:hypothetical protein
LGYVQIHWPEKEQWLCQVNFPGFHSIAPLFLAATKGIFAAFRLKIRW